MPYTREIKMPKTRRGGLANFIQIIINEIEAGSHRSALLSAVDLLEDVNSGAYDDAMADAKGHSAIIKAMEEAHQSEVIAAHHRGFEEGVAEEKSRMAETLGLLAKNGAAGSDKRDTEGGE